MGKAGSRAIILLSLGCFLILSSPAEARTIEVWPGGPIPTIQKALTTAEDGDVIRVHPGKYDGRLVINKSIRLLGLEMPIIDGEGLGDVITIEADEVTVKGFEIIFSGKILEETNAGIKIKSNNNLVEDNRFINNLFGVYLERASENVIRRNLIKGRPVVRDLGKVTLDENTAASSYDIKFAGDGGDGIHLFDSPENLMESNIITDTRDGIYFDYSYHNRVINNQIFNVRYGIHYMYSWYNNFEGNILLDNVAGAAPMFSKYIVFRNNVLAGSRGHRAYGILFAHCDHSLAEGNIVFDNTRGFFLDHSMHNTIRNNLIAMNDIGLDLISSSTDNVFIDNNFIDNMQQIALIAFTVGRGNEFHASGRGNYWSDYRGFDLDQDGVGDIPHFTGDVFTYLMGKAPGVRLFLNSPAAKALEFSEKTFPVISIPKAEDPYPLINPAAVRIPEFLQINKQATNKTLALYSLAMLLAGIILYWRGLSLDKKVGSFRNLLKRGECSVK
ncbi:MAG: nitrous oxide reductase family maturation protein NosD [Bacillota bacterium]